MASPSRSPSTHALADAFVRGDDPATNLASLTKSLSDGSLLLPDLVQTLGKHLTSEEGVDRTRATDLLAECVRQLGADLVLVPAQAKSLCTFFRDRLQDFHSVGPSLIGLLALWTNHYRAGEDDQDDEDDEEVLQDAGAGAGAGAGDGLDAADAGSVVRMMWAKLHVPAMAQKQRQSCFELLNFFLDRPALVGAGGGLSSLGSDLVLGIKEAMWAEKDPRCLLASLRALSRAIVCLDDEALTTSEASDNVVEDLFNVTACYFPITFTPPPNDPFGIKREDLISALRAVFSSTPRMAPNVVPLLLEKLGSTVDAAKLDALQTLEHCLPIYGLEGVLRFLDELAEQIWQEAAHNQDPRVVVAALSAARRLTALVASRGAGGLLAVAAAGGAGGAAAGAAGNVEDGGVAMRMGSKASLPPGWRELSGPLLDRSCKELSSAPDSLVGRASGKVVVAMSAAGSDAATRVVLAQAIPVLLKVCAMALDIGGGGGGTGGAGAGPGAGDQKATIAGGEAALDTLVSLVEVVDPELDFPAGQHPMQPFAGALCAIFQKA
eukprot:g4684.t1